jgi:hypothetical protein
LIEGGSSEAFSPQPDVHDPLPAQVLPDEGGAVAGQPLHRVAEGEPIGVAVPGGDAIDVRAGVLELDGDVQDAGELEPVGWDGQLAAVEKAAEGSPGLAHGGGELLDAGDARSGGEDRLDGLAGLGVAEDAGRLELGDDGAWERGRRCGQKGAEGGDDALTGGGEHASRAQAGHGAEQVRQGDDLLGLREDDEQGQGGRPVADGLELPLHVGRGGHVPDERGSGRGGDSGSGCDGDASVIGWAEQGQAPGELWLAVHRVLQNTG